MKIKDQNPKTSSGGYSRIFGDEKLGNLITKVQATSISNGTELERKILSQVNEIKNLDDFIDNLKNYPNGTYACKKTNIKKSTLTTPNIEPDLCIFKKQENKHTCTIVEIKDGDMLDTKKSKAEKDNLENFSRDFGSKIPFATDYKICCFNQDDKEKIKIGLKGEFDDNHIMTGKELCNELEINYDELVSERKNDAVENINYFVDELLKIDIIKDGIESKIKKE